MHRFALKPNVTRLLYTLLYNHLYWNIWAEWSTGKRMSLNGVIILFGWQLFDTATVGFSFFHTNEDHPSNTEKNQHVS